MVAFPWLGPSWHPAFATVHAARKACEKSDAACVRCAKSKPIWWVELDSIYGKDFLDNLQLSVQSSVLSAKSVAQSLSASGKRTRVVNNRCRNSLSASQAEYGAGTILLQKSKKKKRKSPTSYVKSNFHDVTMTDRSLAWKLRLEESSRFVEDLWSPHAHSCKRLCVPALVEACEKSEHQPFAEDSHVPASQTQRERSFMRRPAVRKNGISDPRQWNGLSCEKKRLLRRETENAKRNLKHVQEMKSYVKQSVQDELFIMTFMEAFRYLSFWFPGTSVRARRCFLVSIRTETHVDACIKRRRKLKGCGSFNPYGSEGPAIGGGKTWIPLPNFQAGDDRYKNMCFIAAVVNLRGLFPAIGRKLQLEERGWKDVICIARSLDNNKYSYAPEHGGQHDAAELLGDCLWGDPLVGIEIIRHTTALDCNHEWRTDGLNMMLVLELPPLASLRDGPQTYSVEELLDHTFQDFDVLGLECAVCGLRSQQGWVRRQFTTPLPAVIAMRVNRYDMANRRRSDRVRPDLTVYVQNEEYKLSAFVEHLNNPKHYVTWLRTDTGFEKRDDGVRTPFEVVAGAVPCTGAGENTYVLVYERVVPAVCSRSSSSQSLSSEREESIQQSLKDTGGNNVEEKEKSEASGQEELLESSANRGVGVLGEASEGSSTGINHVPEIPVPSETIQRSRGRHLGLVQAFSDKPSPLSRCGAACSHPSHDTSTTLQQQRSVGEHVATSTHGDVSQGQNSDKNGIKEETKFPSIELLLGRVTLDSVLGRDANKPTQKDSVGRGHEQPSMNRSIADLLGFHSTASHVQGSQCKEQLPDATSDDACKSAGKESRPAKLFTQNCEVTVSPHMEQKYEFDLWLEVAKQVRQQWLRSSPTVDMDSPSLSSDSRLAAVFCGIKGCQWKCNVPDITQNNLDRKEDHPWDALVRLHVEETHATLISDIVKTVFVEIPSERRVWDVYKAASCLSLL